MDNGVSKKIRQNKQFMEYIAELTRLFGKSDRKALQSAVDAGDFNALCKVMGVDEQKLASILERGTGPAKDLLKDPEIAEALRRRANPTAR